MSSSTNIIDSISKTIRGNWSKPFLKYKGIVYKYANIGKAMFALYSLLKSHIRSFDNSTVVLIGGNTIETIISYLVLLTSNVRLVLISESQFQGVHQKHLLAKLTQMDANIIINTTNIDFKIPVGITFYIRYKFDLSIEAVFYGVGTFKSNKPINIMDLINNGIGQTRFTCLNNKIEKTDVKLITFTTGNTNFPKEIKFTLEQIELQLNSMINLPYREDKGVEIALTKSLLTYHMFTILVPLLRGCKISIREKSFIEHDETEWANCIVLTDTNYFKHLLKFFYRTINKMQMWFKFFRVKALRKYIQTLFGKELDTIIVLNGQIDKQWDEELHSAHVPHTVTYGFAETNYIGLYTPYLRRKIASVGRLSDFKGIVPLDPESGLEFKFGVFGANDDKPMHSNDIFEIDGDDLYFVSRTTDYILCHGVYINLYDIENRILQAVDYIEYCFLYKNKQGNLSLMAVLNEFKLISLFANNKPFISIYELNNHIATKITETLELPLSSINTITLEQYNDLTEDNKKLRYLLPYERNTPLHYATELLLATRTDDES